MEPAVFGVVYDGSPEARAALEEARSLAQAAHAMLKVIAVADPLRRASQERAQEWLGDARAALREDFTVVTRLAVGEPKPELLAISEGLDLLVLGSL